VRFASTRARVGARPRLAKAQVRVLNACLVWFWLWDRHPCRAEWTSATNATCRTRLPGAIVGHCFHFLSACPKDRPGAARSRTSCLSSVISGKRLCSARDQIISPSTRTSERPPVASGVSVTEPMSSANLVNNSCAIQLDRKHQPHNLQYVIPTVGRFGIEPLKPSTTSKADIPGGSGSSVLLHLASDSDVGILSGPVVKTPTKSDSDVVASFG